jgi:hypothetical protein
MLFKLISILLVLFCVKALAQEEVQANWVPCPCKLSFNLKKNFLIYLSSNLKSILQKYWTIWELNYFLLTVLTVVKKFKFYKN